MIKLSRADGLSATLASSWNANIRFAANQISTVGSIENADLTVESWIGNRHASVRTNDLSDESLEQVVRQSEALARLSPADPENLPLLGAQAYKPVDAQFDSTDNSTPEDRVRAALTALKLARSSTDIDVAGFLVSGSDAVGVMNTAGLFAYHASSSNSYSVTARTRDGTGSGWAATNYPDWKALNFENVSTTAITKARVSRNPVAIEPGRYTVILEPAAASDLLGLVSGALNARAADEGRSAFTKAGGGNKIGEKIMDERVTLLSDPQDGLLLGQPFDDSGLPLSRQVWVEKGVLRQLAYNRFWAQKQGRQPTGGAQTLKIDGGPTSFFDMVKSTERGILLTHLFYLRQVDPRTVVYTGLTRDGTFLIENGKIARPIKNFRFNESPVLMLNNLLAMGKPVRVSASESGNAGAPIVVPPLLLRDFNFTSLSDAV